jgi:hypothetical protein
VLGLTGQVGSVRRMDIVNTHQSQAWNGYEGRHWADNHERYNTLAEDATEFVFGWGPVRHWLRDSDSTAAARAKEAVTAALRPFEMDGAVRLRSPGWRFTAVRRQTGL